MERILCLGIGYAFGCFLTGELVARRRTGESAARLGTGNPGMANVAHELGLRWGLLVLLGDIAKTALACLACALLAGEHLGRLALLWACLGVVLGHNFPFWRRFQGGKGVAVTCAGLILYSPLWGTAACLTGLGVTVITGWLPLGAVVIPAVFLPLAILFHSWEAGALALVLTVLMVSRHYHGLGRIMRGEEPRKFRPNQSK
ncbi:glycerol-3-phosphate acyltransferase [Intestinimonas massiliensis (ex Afouda et al. 2020)]|uniref:glycerol-3-phosphate acyltransferase n=1 Tax=Intestinimonas massiliensis (ex Afouda et al. 2020) TaxID=1673721 RepID=UPI0010309133|nr:glycerol-3-phosphate acyltransferase [Intestinimonas massiliensis (ex Afouda et al. 2020)]